MKNEVVGREDGTLAIVLNHVDGTQEYAIISADKLERAQEIPNTWCKMSRPSGTSYVYGKCFGWPRRRASSADTA